MENRVVEFPLSKQECGGFRGNCTEGKGGKCAEDFVADAVEVGSAFLGVL